MSMSTPQLHLETCFVLNAHRRIVATREPNGSRGPLFFIVRGSTGCAWAVRADVPAAIAHELDRIAEDEPAARDFRDPPVNAHRYLRLLAGHTPSVRSTRQSDGPTFAFSDSFAGPDEVVVVENEALLQRNFRG